MIINDTYFNDKVNKVRYALLFSKEATLYKRIDFLFMC